MQVFVGSVGGIVSKISAVKFQQQQFHMWYNSLITAWIFRFSWTPSKPTTTSFLTPFPNKQAPVATGEEEPPFELRPSSFGKKNAINQSIKQHISISSGQSRMCWGVPTCHFCWVLFPVCRCWYSYFSLRLGDALISPHMMLLMSIQSCNPHEPNQAGTLIL